MIVGDEDVLWLNVAQHNCLTKACHSMILSIKQIKFHININDSNYKICWCNKYYAKHQICKTFKINFMVTF